MDTPTRRRFMSALASLPAVLLSMRTACAQSDPFAPLVREVTGGAPVRPGRVTVDTPRLADNGHSVPLKVSVESPMNATDYVRSITLLSERNPRPVMATFYLGPKAGPARRSLRACG